MPSLRTIVSNALRRLEGVSGVLEALRRAPRPPDPERPGEAPAHDFLDRAWGFEPDRRPREL